MRNHRHSLIMIVFAMALVVSGCDSAAKTQNTQTACAGDVCSSDEAQTANAEVERLEIYHFHATNQCVSCIAVGDLAQETINTYYAEEVASGKIVFDHINGELPENREKVVQYGATGSSLWIGTYTTDGQFWAEQNINVWYKINDKDEYMTYLKGVIDKRLAGDST